MSLRTGAGSGGDPIVAWMGNGSLLAGVQSSLNGSQDQACSWSPVLGGQAGQLAVDPLPLPVAYTVDIDPNDPTHIFASGTAGKQQGVLVACTSQALTSRAVGFAADPQALIDAGSAQFSPLLDLTRVSGPLGSCSG